MARKDTVAADDYRAEATMPELEATEREAASLEVELAEIPNLPLDDPLARGSPAGWRRTGDESYGACRSSIGTLLPRFPDGDFGHR